MNHNEKSKFIEQLYMANFDNLLQYAERIMRDTDMAYECVQETFVVALKNPDDLMSSPRPEGWLMNTLKYIMKSTKRSESKVSLTLGKLYAETAHGQDEQNLDVFFKYRGIIGDDDLRIVIRHYCEGYGHAEIAKELNISTSACKKRTIRALKRLGREIKEEDLLISK